MVTGDRALHRVMRRSISTSGRGKCSYDPSEDYTPSPEDIEDQLEALKEENSELEKKNAKLQEDLERLQRAYLRDGKTLNLLQAKNGGLIDKISTLEWDKVALKEERRIAIRTWRTRVRDPVRYFRGVV
ncbi:hypothetical protein L6452_43777 [Arctium lappa]|uniref:Uncharacterized protein n=1 Tax=Arctium lappa TaxID=4217 RepID=A0ACB8XF06_ARCLA|nr:hypothetical protein L6452_43777 [Arctium lappa]